MEIFQQCLTELLRVVVLVIIAGFGVLARMYLVPLLKSWVEKAKSAADLAGIDLTAEQIEQAKEIIAAMVASAYRLKLGGKIEDAKTYVNELAKKIEYCSAITDHGNMFGWYDFKKAMESAGKKPMKETI